jgi:hypothetical protein
MKPVSWLRRVNTRTTIVAVSAIALSLSLANAAFAEGPSLRSIYYCDSEQHARRYAELTLKNDPGKALRMINEESYRVTGTPFACGSTNVLFVEVEAIDDVATAGGTMTLIKIVVTGYEYEDVLLSVLPTTKYAFRKVAGV